jgi:peptidoglycan hydrolase-like protein with peptidoglycan-binding domain
VINDQGSIINGQVNANTAVPTSINFTRNLTLGSTGNDVKNLQIFLNTHSFVIAATGNGSPNYETTYFGALTQKALAKFQKANNITPAVGYFGPITRGKLKVLGY